VSRLLIATTNSGKQVEFRRLLAAVPATIVTPHEVGVDLDVDEPYETYAENATAKATAYTAASGLLTVADDSGIEVAALGWGPGVRSARWGHGRNADRILEALGDAEDRRARMICALAVARIVRDQPVVEVFTGSIEGTIARQARGASGFGYDPVFELPSGLTAAQLPMGEKDRISHRGRAVAAALEHITALVAGDPE